MLLRIMIRLAMMAIVLTTFAACGSRDAGTAEAETDAATALAADDNAAQPAPATPEAQGVQMIGEGEAIIPVAGMTCTNCENMIKGVLAGLHAISECTPDHAKGQVHVKFDPAQIDTNQIIETINSTTPYKAGAQAKDAG